MFSHSSGINNLKPSAMKKKLFQKLVAVFMILLVYLYCSTIEWWKIKHDRCKTPEDEMEDLKLLVKDTHKVLDYFNLTHFPMGGRYLT